MGKHAAAANVRTFDKLSRFKLLEVFGVDRVLQLSHSREANVRTDYTLAIDRFATNQRQTQAWRGKKEQIETEEHDGEFGFEPHPSAPPPRTCQASKRSIFLQDAADFDEKRLHMMTAASFPCVIWCVGIWRLALAKIIVILIWARSSSAAVVVSSNAAQSLFD